MLHYGQPTLSPDAFFAQQPRYPTPINNESVESLRRDYMRRIPINTILERLYFASHPTPSQEKLMRSRGIDIIAYINDNLIASIYKLDHALYDVSIPIMDRLKDAMWDLYVDTMTHPFTEDVYCIGTENTLRMNALESFRETLTRHIILIKSSTPKPCTTVFLDVLLTFARTIFESRLHVVPQGVQISPDMSLWQAHLCLWHLTL